ncbi:TPA: DNA mismatch repair protein MutS, partial [Neisseria gonorrhoeae]
MKTPPETAIGQITGKNMNTDFQKILKQLGKQAKKEAAEKQEAEKNKQKQEYDLDFSQAVGQVSPLKNRQQYYVQS